MSARISTQQRAAQREAEATRIARVRARGHVPDACGSEIPEAPARGAFRVVEPVQHAPDDTSRPSGYRGRKAIREIDAFDRMAVQALRAGKPHPLTASQIAMGRYYRDLTERHAASGMRGARYDGLVGGSGSGGAGGGYMDAVIRDGRRLALLHARIGSGVSLKVRRVRPSVRGTRVNIPDRQLVDQICLSEQSVSEILERANWALSGTARRSCTEALAEALERMMGPARGQVLQVAHFGDGPQSIWAA